VRTLWQGRRVSIVSLEMLQAFQDSVVGESVRRGGEVSVETKCSNSGP
jgi:hypothetical protein